MFSSMAIRTTTNYGFIMYTRSQDEKITYDYAYEDTLEQHALLYDKTGNQLIEV